jgi:hypothetical protein
MHDVHEISHLVVVTNPDTFILYDTSQMKHFVCDL